MSLGFCQTGYPIFSSIMYSGGGGSHIDMVYVYNNNNNNNNKNNNNEICIAPFTKYARR